MQFRKKILAQQNLLKKNRASAFYYPSSILAQAIPYQSKSCTILSSEKKTFMPQKIVQPPTHPHPSKNNGPFLTRPQPSYVSKSQTLRVLYRFEKLVSQLRSKPV